MSFNTCNDLHVKIYFINISKDQSNIFTWKSKYSQRHHIFDVNTLQKVIKKPLVFIHLNKGDIKIVCQKTNNIIFSIGADVEVQFQILESLLEYLIKEFLTQYENILSDFLTGSNQLFQKFNDTIDNSLKNFQSLDLVENTRIFCTVCKENHIIAIKKSLIQKSKKNIVPVVFYHEGITLLIYIDKNFNIRGIERVSLTG